MNRETGVRWTVNMVVEERADVICEPVTVAGDFLIIPGRPTDIICRQNKKPRRARLSRPKGGCLTQSGMCAPPRRIQRSLVAGPSLPGQECCGATKPRCA